MPTRRPATHRFHVASFVTLPKAAATALADSAYGPFELHPCQGASEAAALLAQGRCDLLILDGAAAATALHGPHDGAAQPAMIVVADGAAMPASVLDWLHRGAQDVLLDSTELLANNLGLRLRAAIERKQLERDGRTAYATDLDTGLPHQQQLIEHMSQLIALREREPAPMALIALRIEGLATTEARLGRAAASVLRRKLGVRLRAGVRASDVVAALGDDNFAVLLGSMLSPDDAARVGAKLRKSLLEPFKVAGTDVAVATAIGIGQYPQDGSQPDALLRRAVGLAAAAQAQGRAGFSNFGEQGASTQGAANDE